MPDNKYVTKENLRSAILGLLQRHPDGLSEADIIREMVPPGPPKAPFQTRVQAVTRVTQALMTLKHQHRAWPENGRWTATSKGTKSHG